MWMLVVYGLGRPLAVNLHHIKAKGGLMAKVSLIKHSAINNVDHSRNVIGIEELTEQLLTTEPWSPVLLKSGEYWLTSENFESIQVLALDIDGGLPLSEAVAIFKPYKHIIGTSRNHQKQKGTKAPCDRYRVVLFFDTPVTSAATYKHTFTTFVSELGVSAAVDPLKDVARFFYPCVDIVSAGEGATILPVSAPERKTSPVVISSTIGEKLRLTPASIQFIAQMDDNEQNFHTKSVRMLFDAKSKGYDMEEARELQLRAAPWGRLDAKDEARVRDIYGSHRESFFSATVPTQWPEMYPITPKNPYPKPVKESVRNVEHVISTKMNLTLLYDERAAKVVKNKEFGEPFSETDSVRLRYLCMESKLMSDASKLDVVVSHEAFKNSYDAFKQVFEGDAWDGVDRIQQLFETLKFDSDESPEAMFWYKEYLSRWLRAIAAKYYDPGSQNNVLVFSGIQGAGKSRWLEKLGSVWADGYKEGGIDPGNKDHALVHLEKFIWHIAELDNTTNNRDISALKDFLTRGTISERRPYARKPDSGRSICSFCASVNSTDFLHDNSGNRRFLILPIIGIDAAHDINIKQLFIQVGHEYRNKKPWYFTQDEIKKTEFLTNMFRYKDPVTERLEAGLKPGGDKVGLHELVKLAAGDDWTQALYHQKQYRIGVSNLLMKLNIRPKNHGGYKVYYIDKEALTAQLKRGDLQ